MGLGSKIPYIHMTILELIWALLILIMGIVVVKVILRVFRKSMKKTTGT
ncbi:MAG: hypothetical protein J7L88_00905 [Thermoplasmata archaeon]|nr:hypothetical protein [Thermoplasmata archaeon]